MSCTSRKPKLWALVDCNSFYCSCERLFRPDLEGKPVAVLSNNDGCLIALTPEAKALGWKMGEVYFQVKQRLKRDGVTVFSSNYTLYGDISARVLQVMRTLVPVRQYSIDEAFVPMPDALAAQAEQVGWFVHDRIRRWVGVPVRVGIGETRTLAKLANHWAKKISRVCRLQVGSAELETILEQTPVGDVWGMGRRQSAKLALRGIVNARQLRDMDLNQALKLLTVVGQRTVLELRGIQCITEGDMPVPRKTLVSSRSFGRGVTRIEDLYEAVAMHCAIAGERLRKEGVVAGALAVHLETSRHAEEPYLFTSADVRLMPHSSATHELIHAAHTALSRCFKRGHSYLKGGITLFELEEEAARQPGLLERPVADKIRTAALMAALDGVNSRYGRDSLRYAAQGNAKAFWQMRRELMSPAFTTSWNDLPIMKC